MMDMRFQDPVLSAWVDKLQKEIGVLFSSNILLQTQNEDLQRQIAVALGDVEKLTQLSHDIGQTNTNLKNRVQELEARERHKHRGKD